MRISSLMNLNKVLNDSYLRANNKQLKKIYSFEVMGQLLGNKLIYKQNLYLWQDSPTEKGKKDIFSIKNFRVNRKNNILEFFLPQNVRLNSIRPIFLYSPQKFFLSKLKVVFNSFDKLTCNFPTEVLMVEERAEERTSYDSKNSPKKVIVKYELLKRPLHRSIIDVCNDGLSFKVYKEDIDKFKKGNKLEVSFTDNNGKVVSQKAQVLYKRMQFHDMSFVKYYRIAVQLK
ncbi:hypothetical protein N9N67_09845 [Bacteriovoracaceae bacterium]|nr:hypothetical protein [Bacteriovoracaceae bacterium]